MTTIGDWVRFYRDGVLVIGVVQYRCQDDTTGDWLLSTDMGEVAEDDVLEIRKAE